MTGRAGVSETAASQMPEAAVDPAAWVDKHGDALYRYALVRVRDQSTAEDLVQDALLTACSTTASFKGQSSERTWLIGILRHKVLDHFRRVARERSMSDMLDQQQTARFQEFDGEDNWIHPVSHWDHPERSLEKAEFWVVFEECVGRLPERLRTPFALRELEGLNSEALADVLNTTRNNLWVMLSRARQQLRRCLEARWFRER